jgi:hypothetical protein
MLVVEVVLEIVLEELEDLVVVAMEEEMLLLLMLVLLTLVVVVEVMDKTELVHLLEEVLVELV